MPIGRCAGCGNTGAPRRVQQHIITCDAYATLFSSTPDACLDPVTEYARHRAADTPQARADLRADRLRRRFGELDRQQALATARWATPPDILAE